MGITLFHPPQPTICLFLGGPFSLPAKQSSPQQHPRHHSPSVLLKPLLLLYSSILAFGAISWFQDCIMRRIRRSAEGKSWAKCGARSTFFCDSLDVRTLRPLHQNACRKTQNHAQKQEDSSSADLQAFILFHLSEHLYFSSLSLLSGLWFGRLMLLRPSA